MSHLKERKEKNCLNCGTVVQGKFCQYCGQENIEPKESVWHLISHFFQDITHFDGKFFSTIKYLFTKPGFLSKEYMIGRRASYVNPIRLYVFTSAFFFLIFFSITKFENSVVQKEAKMNGKTFTEFEAMDSASFKIYTSIINKEDDKDSIPMTRAQFKHYFDSSVSHGSIHFTNNDYKTKGAYDSVLQSGKKHHNWFQRQLIYKEIELNNKYHNEGGKAVKEFSSIFLHSLPQMLFILLPLFALILKMLYFRRKQYYYVNHSIFTIHFYIFVFLNLLIIFGLRSINDSLHWSVLGYLQGILGFGIFFYLYKAMRKFYQQRRGKTMLKFFVLCFLLFFTITFLMLFYVLFSLFKL